MNKPFLIFMLFISSFSLPASLNIVAVYSDGHKICGRYTGTEEKKLKIYTHEKKLEVIKICNIKSIYFTVSKRTKARKWTFLEAGQVKKREKGNPYPVIFLSAKIRLYNGSIISGHLYTTNLKIETSDGSTKNIVLKYKYKGEEGESFNDLLYPEKLEFLREGKKIANPKSSFNRSTTAQLFIKQTLREYSSKDAVLVFLSIPDLLRRERKYITYIEKQEIIPKEFTDTRFFSALYMKSIFIYWPWDKDKTDYIPLIRKNLCYVKDFFDEKKILGVYYDKNSNMLFSLMQLRRTKNTSLNKKRKFPWHIEVWRWKVNLNTKKVMLSGRNYFFRGIIGKNQDIPKIVLKKEPYPSLRK